jgi:probable rRNA maturation factor
MTAQTTKSDSNPEPDSPESEQVTVDEWRSANGALIEVTIDTASWPAFLVDDLKSRGTVMLDHIAGRESLAAPMLSLLLCGDAEMQALNRQHCGFDKPTNVLSFPAGDGWPGDDALIGDIAIAAEIVQREAKAAGLGPADHLLHLFTHGVLHLLGYDHIDDDMAQDMETREVELLAGMNVANPYLDDSSDIGTREPGA